ncbi:MAG: hypothetical protein HRU12_07360 [Phaeodactylibacter sp.]|nr:hypothetical protein [Phaeodactylibacter sp.]
MTGYQIEERKVKELAGKINLIEGDSTKETIKIIADEKVIFIEDLIKRGYIQERDRHYLIKVEQKRFQDAVERLA